ncbi:MAG: hypothetical protein KDB22_06420 [Planctomycetales bacterium]|nr:hypothetical protein [Planctomycetales bacterium]
MNPYSSPGDTIDQRTVEAMRRRRLAMAKQLSFAQRLEAARRLRNSASQTLQANPNGWQAFFARNHRKRRYSAVRHLERQMLGNNEPG